MRGSNRQGMLDRCVVAFATLAAALFLLALPAVAQSGSNAGLSVAEPGTGTKLGTESRSEGGETRNLERWIEDSSQKNAIRYDQNVVATPNTPKPVIQPTYTVGATTPTPTAMAARWCRITALATNAGIIVIGGSGVTVTPAIGSAGFQMSPGLSMRFPAKGGDCSGFWVNAPNANDGAQMWSE